MKNEVIDFTKALNAKNAGFHFLSEDEIDGYDVDPIKLKAVEAFDNALHDLYVMENAPMFTLENDGFSAESGNMIVYVSIPLPFDVYGAELKAAVSKLLNLVDYYYIAPDDDPGVLKIVFTIYHVYTKKTSE